VSEPPDPLLVLGSSSPRRARILESLGIPFRVVSPDVDEAILDGEEPASAAERLARAKATAVAAHEALPVLAADTLVVCEGRILGKPASHADAAHMLRLLSGRSHEVVTGVCLVKDGVARSSVERTTVVFAPMSDAEIAWYVATGEPLDKAGAYHVDGMGALFVAGVAGSPSNVEGLPVRLLLGLMRQAGVGLGPPSFDV
jgi:nucleoside triphosphate pyrophosphatase